MEHSIGERLRTTRLEQHVRLAEAAAETRIPSRILAALEENNFARAGAPFYVRGFLRTYARHLSLDPEPLVASYRSEHEPPEPAAELYRPPLEYTPPEHVRRVAMAAAVVALLGLLTVVGTNRGAPAPAEAVGPAVPPPPASAPVAGDVPVRPPAEERPAPREEPAAVEAGVEMALVITEGESWLRITVDGEVVSEGLHLEGAMLVFRGTDEIRLRVGNAGVVRVAVNGQDRGLLGRPGQVVDATYRSADS
jgi:cytoskeleton protein RodZ